MLIQPNRQFCELAIFLQDYQSDFLGIVTRDILVRQNGTRDEETHMGRLLQECPYIIWKNLGVSYCP